MKIKSDEVSFQNLQPQMVLAVIMAQEVYREYDTDMVITSANDSVHSRTSLHFSGNAVDLRIWNLPDGTANEVRDKLQEKLTKDFDVILESDHIHLEYQPKYNG